MLRPGRSPLSRPPALRLGPVLAFAAVILSTSPIVAAADWPQWRGPTRTGQVGPGERPITTLPAAPRNIWKVPAGEGFASPIVAEGRVFAFDAQDGKETLRALDAKDGHELWRTTVDDTFRDSQGPPAPRCTPVHANGRVYAQSCKGELLCVAASDGKKLWSMNFTRDFGATFIGEKGSAPGATRHGNNGSPWVEAEWLFASAGSTNGAGVVALHPATGAVRWKSGNETAAYAAPMVAVIDGIRQVVDFMADAALGFDAINGEVLWRYPLKTAFARHVMTPVIDGNRVIIGSHQTGLIALRISKAGGAWKVIEEWKNKEASPNFSSLVAVGGRLVGLGPNKDVVCVEASTGKLVWSKTGYITGAPDKAHAGFVVVGPGTVLALADSGELALLGVDGAECRDLGRAQVCGANWCNPAIVGGRLFLRDGIRNAGSWWCFDLQP